ATNDGAHSDPEPARVRGSHDSDSTCPYIWNEGLDAGTRRRENVGQDPPRISTTDGTSSRCSTATIRTSTGACTASPCVGAKCVRRMCLKIHKKWPVVWPPERHLASKKLSPNQL